jgi:hypothetical protein
MKAHEHRVVGDEATGAALVDVAASFSEERFYLRHGDVIALSGDFFAPEPLRRDPLEPSGLFSLAAIPGDRGLLPGTRDEVICALKVMAVDEGVADARFQDGGEFAHFWFSPTAARTEVERRVRDRFLTLAAANAEHFLDPWGIEAYDSTQPRRFGSARAAYRRLHQAALDEACRLGREGGDLARAMAREAAAQHYLTDAFASGHLRTPIAAIRQFWYDRYPGFWHSLQRKIATDTAAALRERSWALRRLPPGVLSRRALAAVRARTRTYPAVSLGDLLGRVFHDWDNDHGLLLEGGGMLYGDGHLDEGVGRQRAVAAVRSGNDDVEVAFGLGLSGSRLNGEALYRTVREATGAGASAFRSESHLPRPSADNPPLNWRATDVDDLWRSPIAGSRGTTVGYAISEVLEPGGEVARRLDCLGQGIVEAFDVVDVPVLRKWLGRKACEAYHHGFIEALARDPKGSVLAVVEAAEEPSANAWAAPRRAGRDVNRPLSPADASFVPLG